MTDISQKTTRAHFHSSLIIVRVLTCDRATTKTRRSYARYACKGAKRFNIAFTLIYHLRNLGDLMLMGN
jgi:hypothetical protein